MRLRHIPGADEEIARNPFVIKEAGALKGQWKHVFEQENPIHIEIGMGKGQFLTTLAGQHPDINYIGIELYSSVLIRALEKMKNEENLRLKNIRYLCMNATELQEVFDKGEVERIYLNFSDPWPKARHAQRRLTSKTFFQRYEQVLSKCGQVEFKTDNRELFEFSLLEAKKAGWIILAHTFDLHKEVHMAEDNVMTEYEEKFSNEGNPIHKMVVVRK